MKSSIDFADAVRSMLGGADGVSEAYKWFDGNNELKNLEIILNELRLRQSESGVRVVAEAENLSESENRFIAAWYKKESSRYRDTDSIIKDLLPLLKPDNFVVFENQSSRGSAARSWIDKTENNSFENFVKVLSKIDKEKQIGFAQHWLLLEGNNFDQETLRSILRTSGRKAMMGSIVNDWIQKEGNNFNYEDLKEILSTIDEEYISTIVDTWLFKPTNYTFENLVKILPEVDEDRRSGIVDTWFNEAANNTFENLVKILSTIDEKYRSSFVQTWLDKPTNNSFENLVKILSIIDEIRRSELIDSWVGKDLEYEVLEGKLLKTNKEYKSSFVRAWFDKPANNSFENLVKILPIIDKGYRSAVLDAWLNKPTNNSFENLVKILPIIDQIDRLALIDSWVGKDLEYEVLEGKLSETNKEHRFSFVQAWFEKPANNSFENLVKILPIIEEGYRKADLLDSLIQQGNNLEYRDLETILPALEVRDRLLILMTWFDKPENRAVENLVKILPTIDKRFTSSLVKNWLDKPKNNTPENIVKILPAIIDEEYGSSLVYSCITRLGTPEEKHRTLLEILQTTNLFNKYDLDSIFSLIDLTSPTTKNILDFCNELYDGLEEIQAGLVERSIHNGVIRLNDFNRVKEFIKGINDDEIALDFVNHLPSEWRNTARTLEISRVRFAKYYDSVSELLQSKTLAESLTEEGLKKVVAEFGDDVPTNLADLASYYDFKSDINNFVRLLESKVLEEIRSQYQPSHQHCYVPSRTNEKLFHLTEHCLPQVGDICDALQSKITAVPELNSEVIDVYEINFEGAESITKGDKDFINQSFKVLLRNQNPTPDEVASFFKTTLKLEGDLSGDKANQLREFFVRNKNELAALFAQKGGMEKFTSCIGSLADGCFANIENQVNIALTRGLFAEDDSYHQILYSCFSKNLAFPILRRSQDLHDGKNPLQSSKLKTESFFPKNLLSDLAKEFYDKDGKKLRDPWELIKKRFGVGVSGCLSESLIENYPEDDKKFNQAAAKLAACIVIEQTMPQLFKSQFLQMQKREFDGLVGAAMKEDASAVPSVAASAASASSVIGKALTRE
jgi:hypothetical protein